VSSTHWQSVSTKNNPSVSKADSSLCTREPTKTQTNPRLRITYRSLLQMRIPYPPANVTTTKKASPSVASLAKTEMLHPTVALATRGVNATPYSSLPCENRDATPYRSLPCVKGGGPLAVEGLVSSTHWQKGKNNPSVSKLTAPFTQRSQLRPRLLRV